MARFAYYIKCLALAGTMILAACSDQYMDELNRDPSKAGNIDPNAQLTTAQLQTYGDLGMVEIYRNYFYAFTQQLMGNWNTTNFGGRHTVDNDEMGRLWTRLYPVAVKNLTDAIQRTNGNAAQANINAALRIYRVYLMSILTDTYGDVPYKEAGMGFIDNVVNPRYDTQEEIYKDFFDQLSSAEAALSPNANAITGDVIYAGDVLKWKKLANSLRLRYAMRISDVNPQKAQQEFENALKASAGVIETLDQDALIKYMSIAFSFGQESYDDYRGNALSKLLFGNDPANNPSYMCATLFNQLNNTADPRTFALARCYYDGLMSATSTDNRIDLTQEMLSKGVAFAPCQPGAFSWDPWPTGYTSDLLTALAANNPKIAPAVNREVEPKVANFFLKSNNPGVIITAAEVKLLMAEAKLKGWDVSQSVEQLYQQGVRLAMDFLSRNYDCPTVSDADFQIYIAANGIGHTAEQAKAAINTQAWILHFTNPAECWANLRRADYPILKSPADYGYAQYLTGGSSIPVRLRYPVLEASYNKQGYGEAVQRMGGSDNWNSRVWWDKK